MPSEGDHCQGRVLRVRVRRGRGRGGCEAKGAEVWLEGAWW